MKKLLKLFGLVRIKDLKPVIIRGPGIDKPIYRLKKDSDTPLLDVNTMETEYGHGLLITDFNVQFISSIDETLIDNEFD